MEQTLELLPSRPKPSAKIELAGKPIKLGTNLYQISLKRSPNIQQYTVEVQPSIDDHAVSLFRSILQQIKQVLKNEIGFITARGRVLWGTKMASKVLILKIGRNVQKGIVNDYQILIKHTRSIAYADISTLKGNSFRQIQQIYTVALRQKMLQLGFQQNIKNRFVERGDGQMVKGYNILNSFELKLLPVMKKMNLLVDIGFRLLNQYNALQQLQDQYTEKDKRKFAVGKIVVTMYNNRSYRIVDVCFDKNPKSTFYNQKRGKNMTFKEYFEEYYKITPSTYNQPLFETIISSRYEIKGETKVKIQNKGYLIPQFCKFAATLNGIKGQSFQSFSEISKRIKISPQERKKKQLNLISQINNKEGQFLVSERCTQADAFVYQDITVIGRGSKLCHNGLLKELKQIKEPRKFNRNQTLWVYYNPNKNSNEQYKNAYQVFDNLSYAAEYYDIEFTDAEFLEVTSQDGEEAEGWIQRIDRFFSKRPQLRKTMRIIVLLLESNQKKYYGDLKKYITNQLALPCQVILKKTTAHKNKTSILGKVALQMNAKCGNTLWSVKIKHSFWAKKRIAYGAFSVSRNVKPEAKKKVGVETQHKKSDVLAFVGTTSQDHSKIYSNALIIDKPSQLKIAKHFQEMLVEWIKNFKSKQQNFPEIIIIYREGLTDNQIKIQSKAEIEAINNVIKRAKSKYPNYDPQVIYILVSKKSSKRLYRPERTQASGKFAPTIMNNPIPGTIVFESISNPEIYDFHLMAQNINQGTATLTNYQVAYDASKIPQQAIAQFTMQQCYNYPNWQGGISVPGCLQSADRLSKLVGEHIHQNITDKTIEYQKSSESLRNKPFYL